MPDFDGRLVAIGLAIVGVLCATFLPLYALMIITGLVITASIVGLRFIMKTPTNGTSGGLGAAILVLGATVCYLVPMWVADLLYALLR
jgi:hypothetical protein